MEGMSCREVAELNGIAPSTVVQWSGRQRETGSPAAKAMGGKRPYLLEEWRD
jgi:transposase